MSTHLPPITSELLEACRSSVPVELQVPPVTVTVTVREIPTMADGPLTMLWRWQRGDYKSRVLTTFAGPAGLRLEQLVLRLFPGLDDPLMGASLKWSGTATGSRVIVHHRGQTEEIIFTAVQKPAHSWADAIHTDA